LGASDCTCKAARIASPGGRPWYTKRAAGGRGMAHAGIGAESKRFGGRGLFSPCRHRAGGSPPAQSPKSLPGRFFDRKNWSMDFAGKVREPCARTRLKQSGGPSLLFLPVEGWRASAKRHAAGYFASCLGKNDDQFGSIWGFLPLGRSICLVLFISRPGLFLRCFLRVQFGKFGARTDVPPVFVPFKLGPSPIAPKPGRISHDWQGDLVTCCLVLSQHFCFVSNKILPPASPKA